MQARSCNSILPPDSLILHQSLYNLLSKLRLLSSILLDFCRFTTSAITRSQFKHFCDSLPLSCSEDDWNRIPHSFRRLLFDVRQISILTDDDANPIFWWPQDISHHPTHLRYTLILWSKRTRSATVIKDLSNKEDECLQVILGHPDRPTKCLTPDRNGFRNIIPDVADGTIAVNHILLGFFYVVSRFDCIASNKNVRCYEGYSVQFEQE